MIGNIFPPLIIQNSLVLFFVQDWIRHSTYRTFNLILYIKNGLIGEMESSHRFA